jgi:SAM-dependent methyltransferase
MSELKHSIADLFSVPVSISDNTISYKQIDKIEKTDLPDNQNQTKDIFSDKWSQADEYKDIEKLYQFQYDWFLKLYGFESEAALAAFLSNKNLIIDTGCGLGYKAAWFAQLAPHATVLGIDISDAAYIAAKNFKHLTNLYFIKGDIADTKLKSGVIDFTVCDQVIMHTEIPENTFAHLSDITAKNGEFACYVYAKKALPRELLDDYFRTATHNISREDMWAFSQQLTTLGKTLSDLNIQIDVPDMPVLGIKGGSYDIQRFIYWNFMKCFWREEWGYDLCVSTNFDWYAPSNAKRFSKTEFLAMVNANKLSVAFLHEEEACHSGRFLKS